MLLRTASPELQSRLASLHRLSPEYGQQLGSHLPMALAALDAMGASPNQLDRFANGYRASHTLTPQRDEGRRLRDWPALLGSFDFHADLRQSLAQQLRQQGRPLLLTQALPLLLESPGAAAFHGLIRTAHALESGVDAELVEALAYWGSRWLPLPETPAAAPEIGDPALWLDRLDAVQRHDAPTWQSDAPLIAQRMQTAARGRAWRRWAGSLATEPLPPQDLLMALARAAAARYLRSGNFTVLHMVTGLRAAAVLDQVQPLTPAARTRLLGAVAAASLASRLWQDDAAHPPAASDWPAPSDWPQLLAQACTQSDDHAIKLVHALAWWQDRHPDPLWGRAAQRALQR
ncbi:questin oxidase family protein [Pelomonas sp. CA6]|uniref:questin oxidase family protein n=1 Tax=Pelomonas sp. CA6 TaxID=2907999 RepID=UPI001F4BD130|nr:questin oxidase family protein [Pelomonas sp. CA6]MCH7344524.1 questin oxidase family protein [Pelomonas sp. CA6]